MPSQTPHLTSKIIRAGAGAGKTQALSDEVLRVAELFWQSKKQYPRIVVTTFTKKATEELRERLLKDACEKKPQPIIQYVSKNKDLHISTIHGVLALFLRRYGHLVGLDAHFQVITDIESDRARKRILRDFLAHKESANLPTGYRLDEIAEISTRIEHHFADQKQIQPVSFSILKSRQEDARKAVLEKLKTMSLRLEKTTTDEKWSSYFGLVLRWTELALQNQIQDIEFPKKPRLSSRAKAPFDLTSYDEHQDLIEEFDKFDDRCMTDTELEAVVDGTQFLLQLSREISDLWQKEKKSRGLLEMSDLENVTLAILRSDSGLAKAFAADWDYWLIDEYQDTSPLQEELLNLLSGDRPQFLVGDPQQSIYLFRGARSEVFRQRERKFKSENKSMATLMTNYRSRPELLQFLNDFFTTGNSAQFAAMIPREKPSPEPYRLPVFRLTDDEDNLYGPILEEIQLRLKDGKGRFDDFCILGRQNKELYEIARYLESYGLPVHVHSSSGFYKRQETLDCLTLLKFIVQPLDNENFVRLLRSPWYRISDSQIIEIAQLKNSSGSYWDRAQSHLSQNAHILKLSDLLVQKKTIGIFETFRKAVLSCGLLEWTRVYDPTGRRESNIWKLIYLLKDAERKPGFNVLNFIRDGIIARTLEEGTEADAVAALEPNRINLMTVHGSKGLKFKHVLVANAHKKPRDIVSRGHEISIVVDEETGLCVVPIRAGEEQKRKQTIYANQILSSHRMREREEVERMLYVALTRAQESIVIHGRTKPEDHSWLSFFKGNLSPGEHTISQSSYLVRHDCDTPQLHRDKHVNTVRVRDLFTSHDAPVKDLERISVTAAVEEAVQNQVPVLKPSISVPELGEDGNLSAKDIQSLQDQIFRPILGSYLHILFEVLHHRKALCDEVISKGSRASNSLCELMEDMKTLDRDKIFDAIDYCLQLQEPPLAALIRQGHAEWGFQAKMDGRLVEGQIDLWGTMGDITWVIDYKSGSSGFEKKAQHQLELYKKALEKFGVRGPIRMAVVYAVERKFKIFD